MPEPYTQYVMGDANYTHYLGGNNTGVASNYYNATQAYRFINTQATTEANLVYLDISSSNQFSNLTSGQKVVVTLSVGDSTSNAIPLIGAGVVSSASEVPPACNSTGAVTCQGSNGSVGNVSAVYTPGTKLRVSFSVTGLCSTTGLTGGAATSICANYTTMTGVLKSQLIYVTFSAVSDSTSTGAVSGGLDSSTFTLAITDAAPTITCSSTNIADYYFPGDGQVFVTPGNYSFSANSGGGVRYLLFLATRGAVTPITSTSIPTVNEVTAYVSASTGTQAINGFINTTDNSDNAYQAEVYAQNEAGILSTGCSVPSPYFKSQPIRGVLTESKCFIATAAFQDGRAKPVMMLRQFRDEVLARHAWGQNFIQAYYKYSPALAEWAWDKPFVRAVALRALVPVQMIAWVWLKFSQAESYIEQLQKSDPATRPEPKGESYIDQERKKLEPVASPSKNSYSEEIKKEIGDAAPDAGYADQQKKVLPAEKVRESPIKMVQEGRDKLPLIERPPIKHGMSFKMGITPGMKVVNPSSGVTFGEIYGSNWQPDLFVHYERPLLNSRGLGTFAFGVDAGVSYGEGYGRLTFAFNGTTISQTKFSFFQMPLLLDAYYRINWLSFLRPYVGAGIGSMFYMETRKDSVPNKRGYSPIYFTAAGASLQLDFFDDDSALEGFLSTGIQHTYVFVEYFYLSSLTRTSTYFERSGIYSGFQFEF